jgi:ketosteroid isomerase-like protein
MWPAMLALLFVGAGGVRTYAAEAASADEQAISKIEREWAEATKTRNKATFDKYLSDDFTFINENGEFSEGRSAYVDAIMKLPEFVEYSVTDEKIRVRGSTAVATGRFAFKDAKSSGATRYTDTFVKGPGGWTAIASQETKTK